MFAFRAFRRRQRQPLSTCAARVESRHFPTGPSVFRVELGVAPSGVASAVAAALRNPWAHLVTPAALAISRNQLPKPPCSLAGRSLKR